MNILASQIAKQIKAVDSRLPHPDMEVSRLLTDSRTLTTPDGTLFFAIVTDRNSGMRYVADLYQRGVRNFVVPNDLSPEEEGLLDLMADANLWRVRNVVASLQLLAAWKRSQFSIPVIGVTGSNGKTIVKDWLVQLLSADKKVVSSPKSYNSQIGVPLSVWQMDADYQVGVFEAGISAPLEMEHLRTVIQPTIGLFTNIGQAHDMLFIDRRHKVNEKLQLFTHCDVLVYCCDHRDIHAAVSGIDCFREKRLFTWGTSEESVVRLLSTEQESRFTRLNIGYNGAEFEVAIPFIDRASIENAMHCITLMLLMGYSPAEIASRCGRLVPVEMRLEMNEGVNNCRIINDSYSLDLNSLTIALDFLQHEQQHTSKTLVISDFLQTGMAEDDLYAQVVALLAQRGITKLIGIGEILCRNQQQFADFNAKFYRSTEDFLQRMDPESFQSETILLKGARVFRFERIAMALQRKQHETIMEVNLDALVNNMNYYRSLLRPSTKLMAMVKASSYGAGKVEIANALQRNHVDYLTVAYSDEGVDLRNGGISLPIMVMNPEEECFDSIIRHRLEPDIYSFRVMELFEQRARIFRKGAERYPVHLEFDTGMHRLGFSGADVDKLVSHFADPDCPLEVCSIFSHLACSEDPAMDAFTRSQISKFQQWSAALKSGLARPDICCHILNSSGIVRFPDAQFDMVRLGIGLYGLAPQPEVQRQLQLVSRIRTKVSQVKRIPQGDSVGYNRRWVAQCESSIAIIPIGYADGFNRRFGYGNGSVLIGGHPAPIIGSVCMDMCFADVTGIDCREGDEVIVFGDAAMVHQMSEAAGTIPYEILTSISPRVKRVYYTN